MSAKLLVDGDGCILTLNAFGLMVHRMAHTSSANAVTQEMLLKTPPFSTITYNNKNVITGVVLD